MEFSIFTADFNIRIASLFLLLLFIFVRCNVRNYSDFQREVFG